MPGAHAVPNLKGLLWKQINRNFFYPLLAGRREKKEIINVSETYYSIYYILHKLYYIIIYYVRIIFSHASNIQHDFIFIFLKLDNGVAQETIKDGYANFYLQQRSQASNIVPQQMFIEKSQIHVGPENVNVYWEKPATQRLSRCLLRKDSYMVVYQIFTERSHLPAT